MILDKLLLQNTSSIGKRILQKAGLESTPKNINEMHLFLEATKKSIESNEFEGALLGNILFSFVSSTEVRDRNVTSRVFEDIFAGLFNEKCTDKTQRSNPSVIQDILNLDTLCKNEDWLISTDLAGNKREKSDLELGNYSISLKTLKGKVYDINDNIIDTNFNSELNVGSLSYRALLKGILLDEQLETLKDRKGGLGSKPQMLKFVLNPINDNNNLDMFKSRLSLFLNYVYNDDVYIVLKSHYRIIFYLIPRETFISSLLNMLDKDYEKFAEIFYRWENNNLRLNWVKMVKAIEDFELPYYYTSINLQNSIHNSNFELFYSTLNNLINQSINKFMDNK